MKRSFLISRWDVAETLRARWLVAVSVLLCCALGVWAGCGGTTSESVDEDDDEALVGGCGTERWSVKTGTDPDVGIVNRIAQPTTITSLLALPAPKTLPAANRIAPTEEQVFRLTDVTLQQFKLEADNDIHLIVSDGKHTMNVEIPSPKCVKSGSPFAAEIAKTRATFTAKYTPSSNFTTANIPISVDGVGFFDKLHGQRGGAANGVELHAVLDLCFGLGCTLSGDVGDGGVPDGGHDGGGIDAGHGDAGHGDAGHGDAGGHAIETVFIVLMENHNWSSIKGSASAPYINGTLLPMGSHTEAYVNPPGIHPSEPNYIWLESGSNLGVTNDNNPSSNHQSTTSHLSTLLDAAGISWKSYAEGISGATCPLTNSGLYAPKHVPFVFFDDVTNTNSSSSATCIQHVRPFSELANDLAQGTVARYNFITPDLCDDMHNSTGCATSDAVKNGDTWLSHELPKIFASSSYAQGGAVFVTWDESEGGDFPIGMIVLSPHAKGHGYSNTISYSHSSTLRTMQEIFGVGPFLRGAANATDLGDLFTTFP